MMKAERLNVTDHGVNWCTMGLAGDFEIAAPAQLPMRMASPVLQPAGVYMLASARLQMGAKASIISWFPQMSPVASTTPLAALYCTNEPSSAVVITPVIPLAASPTSCSACVLNTNSAPFAVAES